MVDLPQTLRELRPTLALAFPMIVGQVGQMLIGITDSAMIGRVGTVELAAAAFAHGVFGVVFIVGLGLLLSVGVFSARDHGSGNIAGCAEWLRHGRRLACLVGLGALGLIAVLSTQLHRFGQPPEVVAIVRPYLLLIATSSIPALLFSVQRQFAEAFGRPWVPMIIMLADVGLNAVLNWAFIWGHWGVPALGLVGSGIATLIARAAAVVAIGVWLQQAAVFAEVRRVPRAGWVWDRFRAMLGFGVPVAGSLLFEAGAFGAAALMMGGLGATALAAHQVALSCAAFTFMFPLGLSMAASMRISKAVGEGRHDALRSIGFGALGLAAASMAVCAVVFALAGGMLARFFSKDPAVTALAAQLLVIAAIFQVFDGSQVVGAGILRGLADVKVPTVLTFTAYWVIALPLGYWLAFHTPLGPLGIWSGLAAGLACAAVLLGGRFHHKSPRRAASKLV